MADFETDFNDTESSSSEITPYQFFTEPRERKSAWASGRFRGKLGAVAPLLSCSRSGAPF